MKVWGGRFMDSFLSDIFLFLAVVAMVIWCCLSLEEMIDDMLR